MKTKIFNTMNLCALGLLCALSASCSDDNYGPDPSKDWAGTTTSFTSNDENGFQTYYKDRKSVG